MADKDDILKRKVQDLLKALKLVASYQQKERKYFQI